MAKRLLVTIFLFIFSFNIFAEEIMVISDLDDTIKQTNVKNPGDAAYNALFTQKVFSGIPELFDSMKSYTDKLYVLTNSFNFFRYNIFKLLDKFDIQALEVSTRHLFRDKDGFKYKYEYIVDKMKETNGKVILMGDDNGKDPEVYAEVLKNYPDKVLSIYIHKVMNRKLPRGITSYITAFEIAVHEFEKGRMNLNDALVLGESSLNEFELKNIIPKFSYCPKVNFIQRITRSSELENYIQALSQKIIKYCIHSYN